jgi:hypothetical protein
MASLRIAIRKANFGGRMLLKRKKGIECLL